MLRQVYKLDELGYLKEILIKDFDEQESCTEENIVSIDPPQGLYIAKLNGIEWIEDMTQEEIDALNNIYQQPTEEEINAELDNAIMSATTLEELKSALIGKNKSVRVRGKHK